MSTSGQQRVCVIGAGSSGLIAARELKAAGINDFVVLETQEGPGGLYKRDNYENSCHTSNKCYTSFACAPPPDLTQCDHYTLGGYVKYLEEFAEKFDLGRHIQYRTKVEAVARDGDGWKVTYGGRTSRFEIVVCCSGTHTHHCHPKAHAWLEGFCGNVLHSSEFRKALNFKDKRVVICGGGESAADISVQCSKVAGQTWLAMRPRTGHVTNRAPHLPEVDHASEARVQAHIKDPDNVPPEVSFDTDLTVAHYATSERLFGVHGYKDCVAMATKDFFPGTKMNVYNKSVVTSQFGTKSGGFSSAIARYGCVPKPPVASCEGTTVIFEDGTKAEHVDAVILCIGYTNDIEFLVDDDVKAKVVNPRNSLKHVAHPDVPNFFLVGFVRPAFGNIPTLAELQARWVAQLVTGRTKLPPRADMLAKIEEDREYEETTFVSGKRLKALTNYYLFAMDMATLTDTHPDYARISLEDPLLFLKLVVGQFNAYAFRLKDDYDTYRKCIMDMPVSEVWHLDLALLINNAHLYLLFGDAYKLQGVNVNLNWTTRALVSLLLFLNPLYVAFVVVPCAYVTLISWTVLELNSVRLVSNLDSFRAIRRPSYYIAKTPYDALHIKWSRAMLIFFIITTLPLELLMTALVKKHLINKSHIPTLKFMQRESTYKKIKANFVFFN
ncbi:hypothetical protein CTAYLR_004499 [Chrysophaeum taylorii]|uniref:Flavin-containing monooxygenase n=1 Tax=Chrysophaeum taylorii TaxID=2483200 RepID=A0AAD7XGY6_9STRA|nr:hypothetical protein CTAYLR_004499 [Chrysophaeum taylorii]